MKNARAHKGKKSSSQWPLVLAILLAISVVIFLLLAVGIFSLPFSRSSSDVVLPDEHQVEHTSHETKRHVTHRWENQL